MPEQKEIFKPLFSERKRIANEAREYLKKEGADQDDATNIVSALSALGYLQRRPER